MSDLGVRRLAWHTEESEARDVRMSSWNGQKATKARRGMSSSQIITKGPKGLRAAGHDALAAQLDEAWGLSALAIDEAEFGKAIAIRRRAVMVAVEWSDCECGRVFKPITGDREYRSCFHCSQLQNSSGRPSCALCSRRHSASYGACFACKANGLEDLAAHIRSVTTRRDAFTCAMCHGTEGSIEVDHILPVGGMHGGSADPWNVQVLCTSCQITKGKQYGPLDELARLELMQAYSSYLAPFLFPDQRVKLTIDLEATLGGDMRGAPRRDEATLAKTITGANLGEVEALDGILNVSFMFGAKILSQTARPVSEKAAPAVNTSLPDPCRGEVVLSTGSRPCRNRTDYKVVSLCMEGCR